MTSTPERRSHPRFAAWLPLRVKVIAGKVELDPWPLLTQSLSKTGISFHAPQRIEPGQLIEVEITLLGVGPGGNNIYVSGRGYIVRAEPAQKAGWYKLAAAFDESTSSDDLDWQKFI